MKPIDFQMAKWCFINTDIMVGSYSQCSQLMQNVYTIKRPDDIFIARFTVIHTMGCDVIGFGLETNYQETEANTI